MMMTTIGFNPAYRTYAARPAFKSTSSPAKFQIEDPTQSAIDADWQTRLTKAGSNIQLNAVKDELVGYITGKSQKPVITLDGKEISYEKGSDISANMTDANRSRKEILYVSLIFDTISAATNKNCNSNTGLKPDRAEQVKLASIALENYLERTA